MLNEEQQSKSMGWFDIGAAGLGVVGGLLGGIGARKRERRSVENQKELMYQQMQNQMMLNEQGQQLALGLWEQTNAPAQMAMLREAGLNPALMYKQSGPGGSTVGQGGGSAGGGQAPGPQSVPMEIGAAISAAKAMKELEVMSSVAKKNEAEADNLRGAPGTIGESVRESNLADALNKGALTQLNKLGYEIGNATKEDQIDRAHYEVEQLIQQNNLTEVQAEKARTETAAIGIKMQLDRANIALSEAQAEKIANDIILGWKELDAKLQQIGIMNQGNKLRALEGKTDLQRIKNDFILGALGKEIDLMKLNVEQQRIFVSLFNGMLGSATNLSKGGNSHNYIYEGPGPQR